MTISRRERRARTQSALKYAFINPPRVPPGHYQSPMNSRADIDRALSWDPEAPGVDLNAEHQVAVFTELVDLMDGAPARRYRPDNTWFYPADAAVYRAMLRRVQPRRVVEVGSGYSTATLLDTAEECLPGLATVCIEPYPDRLLELLRAGDDIELIKAPAQDVAMSVFTSLDASDILFIDSSHVGKAGSDVLWLLLHVLPRLKSGVLVHIHDVFWPFEYPADWLRLGRNWNELYFVQAFLCHNDAWRIELFSDWIWRERPDLIPPVLRSGSSSSLWLSRR